MVAKSTPDRDPFAPRFEILIEGNQLSEVTKRLISEITVEDDADIFDKIQIKMNAMETSPQGQVIDMIDSKLFSPGNLIEVQMGYGSKLNTVCAGYLVKNKPDFGVDGPTLAIEAYDVFYKLSQNKNPSARNFPSVNVADIIESVLAPYGIPLETPEDFDFLVPTTPICQHTGINDYEFVNTLAKTFGGLEFYNRWDAHAKKFIAYLEPATDKQDKIFTFQYFSGIRNSESTLLSFSPQLSTADQATQFEILSWDRGTKNKISTAIAGGGGRKATKTVGGIVITKSGGPKTVGGIEIKPKGKGAADRTPSIRDAREVTFKAFGEIFSVIPDKPFADEKSAKIYIENWINCRLDNFITATGATVGLEVLQSRQKHEIQGVGNLFSGKYYFTNVTHTMGRGQTYQSKFNARKVISEVGS